MAWEARLGLKQSRVLLAAFSSVWLNGLGSPSGIETVIWSGRGGLDGCRLNGLGSPSGIETVPVCNDQGIEPEAKWPGKPVWD